MTGQADCDHSGRHSTCMSVWYYGLRQECQSSRESVYRQYQANQPLSASRQLTIRVASTWHLIFPFVPGRMYPDPGRLERHSRQSSVTNPFETPFECNSNRHRHDLKEKWSAFGSTAPRSVLLGESRIIVTTSQRVVVRSVEAPESSNLVIDNCI